MEVRTEENERKKRKGRKVTENTTGQREGPNIGDKEG